MFSNRCRTYHQLNQRRCTIYQCNSVLDYQTRQYVLVRGMVSIKLRFTSKLMKHFCADSFVDHCLENIWNNQFDAHCTRLTVHHCYIRRVIEWFWLVETYFWHLPFFSSGDNDSLSINDVVELEAQLIKCRSLKIIFRNWSRHQLCRSSRCSAVKHWINWQSLRFLCILMWFDIFEHSKNLRSSFLGL